MASRLDALKRQKEQNSNSNQTNDYGDVLDVLMNKPVSETKSSNTSKEISDIDVNLIDVDDINELLFGYEDLDKIEQSFNIIGNNSVIYVYKRANGRYLCFAGNQRLIATKNRDEKTITCVIAGDEPSEDERIEQLIFMNSQRTPRPYYIAQQLSEYEKILRRKGKTNITELIEEKFGYKGAMQRRYKQILKLNVVLQNLFKREDIPFTFLLDKCTKLPPDKENEFAYVFNTKAEEEEVSTELINRVYTIVMKKDRLESDDNSKVKYIKSSQAFKELTALPFYDNDLIVIPKDKKDIIKTQAEQYKEYLDKVLKACE